MERIVNLILDVSEPDAPRKARKATYESKHAAHRHTLFDSGPLGYLEGCRGNTIVLLQLQFFLTKRYDKFERTEHFFRKGTKLVIHLHL